MSEYRGKTAIVTGGASGIGRALCVELAARGTAVTVADINGDGARQVAEEIVAHGGRAVAAMLDVTDRAAVFDLVARTGRLDYMVNNAGFCIQGELRDMTPELWRKIVDINLWGVIHGTTAAYDVMRRQGAGHIVNVASFAGLVPLPTQSAYSATKHAVVALSGALRSEAAALGVRVSVVCPGFVATGMMATTPVLQARMDDVAAFIPFRLLPAERMAQAILRGVSRNRGIIVAPASVRLLWPLYRFFPELMERTAGRHMVKLFRSVRRDTDGVNAE